MLDCLITHQYYWPHIAPIWNALPVSERGVIYASEGINFPDAIPYTDMGDCGHNPILCAAYGDAFRAVEFDSNRPVILMEHGIGLTPSDKAAYCSGTSESRKKMAMFLLPNQYSANKAHPDLKHIPHVVIGMPKLDYLAGELQKKHVMPEKPTIAIAFHHGDKNSRPPEQGSAWEHYINYLPEVARKFNVIVHCHPLSNLKETYDRLGLKYVEDFKDVMAQADIYVNDCSSTMYEFLATGKPVVILNAPWFDRKVERGLRFWDYTNIGTQVNEPIELIPAIEETIRNPDGYKAQRQRAVSDLLPFIGSSAQRAAEAVTALSKKIPAKSPVKSPVIPEKKVEVVEIKVTSSKKRGLLYMAFGEKAKSEMLKSVNSLRKTGCDYPVTVVGDVEVEQNGITCLPWKGQDPFDMDAAEHFQFRAGRVKPFLNAYSPYAETMYADCDTRFLVNPAPAFDVLKYWDFVATQERLDVCELYNRPNAKWFHGMDERDDTSNELGGLGYFPFWNSGIFLFKKSKVVKELFDAWYQEWMRYQLWDEQLSLMRAAFKSKVRIFVLGEQWNHPHPQDTQDLNHGAKLILHQYGIGAARS